MKTRRSRQVYHVAIYLVAIVAVVLGAITYSGFALDNWSVTLSLALLLIYLQTIVVRVGERIDYSLSTAAIFPIIYLVGNTPAMIIAGLSGLADGIFHKKDWRRALFNVSQLAISALIGALAHDYALETLGTSGLAMVVAMLTGIVAYVVTNVCLVSLMVAVWREVSWWSQLRQLSMRSFYSSFSGGFIGLVFAFFVIAYGFWGVVGFGALLIMLSELLKGVVEVTNERARRKELEEELVTDEMTGALNFRFLNKWLSEPSDQSGSVLFLDIDDFSVFNNTYGHAEGDKVLKLFVDTMNQSVRSEDKVIRYGGDEFVVLLKGMDADGAQRVAERVMNNLKSRTDTNWDQPITVSIGIATKPEDTRDKHQLLLFADQAMYAAKDSGKDRFCLWSYVAVTASTASTVT